MKQILSCGKTEHPQRGPCLFSPPPPLPQALGPLEISRLWLISCSCSLSSLQVHTLGNSGEDQGGKGTCVPPESTKLRKVQRSWQTPRVGTCRFYFSLHSWVPKTLKIVLKTNSAWINILMYSCHSIPFSSLLVTKAFVSSRWDLKRDLICAWGGKRGRAGGRRGVNLEQGVSLE